jgi:starch phosphorylase
MSQSRHVTSPQLAASPSTSLSEAIAHHLRYSLGKRRQDCSPRELCLAVSLAIRNRLIDQMLATEERCRQTDAKRLYYLSMEFLIGRSLSNNLMNLGLMEACREALATLDTGLEEVLDQEEDAALGNGGLGRLAACFLDSLATLHMPGYGCGINYEYGLFKQMVENGYQREQPDHWSEYGSPWLMKRPDEACLIPLYGRLEHGRDPSCHGTSRWVDCQMVIGQPHDLPIAGYGGHTVNTLRLYSARSSHQFDMQVFQRGDYFKAVEQKITSETISKVLYPSDSVEAGRELRLIQEYFLVACALEDILRTYLVDHDGFDAFPDKVAIQLNDTHPALMVAELMRRFVDDYALPWKQAWEITQATLAYTNHTLLPEALEKWPVSLFERVLPRHLQIIYDINHQFLHRVAAVWPGERARLQRMSIIEESEPKHVRMAHLAMIGSHSINGVSALHSTLIQQDLVPDFFQLWPERFNNKTNGITQRRWLLQANPRLAALISQTLGESWITDLESLRALASYAQDTGFQHAFMEVKHANKQRLAQVIAQTTGVQVLPESLFDIQVKRIHEYKRQSLNMLYMIHTYLNLVEDQIPPLVPRTFVFAGKAAPEYWAAKQIIKMIHCVAEIINHDPRVEDQIKVVFIPDYRVSLAEIIIPAADLSEQISTAGMEASGTGNMKFALNGALTIGTLDGANIEIREEVGAENIFIFGLRTEAIHDMRRQGTYNPRAYYNRNPALRRILDALQSDRFCPHEPGLFDWFCRSLLDQGDYYFHLADLESYIPTQEQVARDYQEPAVWHRKAILNVANVGAFSSDRTIREYARDIWQIQPVHAGNT